jgi:hypothetical protein
MSFGSGLFRSKVETSILSAFYAVDETVTLGRCKILKQKEKKILEAPVMFVKSSLWHKFYNKKWQMKHLTQKALIKDLKNVIREWVVQSKS